MLEAYRRPELAPSVRALAWSVASQPLVQVPCERSSDVPALRTDIDVEQGPDLEIFQTQMQALNRQPQSLQEWLSSAKSQRLGHLFERYWHYYWLKVCGSEEVIFNRQINAEGVTLGELDAVFYHADTQALRHFELAHKFYLGYQRSDNTVAWIGPNAKDRLDLKLKQMTEKQLTLLDRVKPDFPKHWKYKTYSRHLLVRGWLFYPFHETVSAPSFAGQQHHRGTWLKRIQLENLPQEQHSWAILRRDEWLGWFLKSKQDLQSENRLLSKAQLIEQLTDALGSRDFSVMFVRLSESALDGNFLEEQRRYILVDDDWPALTSRSFK